MASSFFCVLSTLVLLNMVKKPTARQRSLTNLSDFFLPLNLHAKLAGKILIHFSLIRMERDMIQQFVEILNYFKIEN